MMRTLVVVAGCLLTVGMAKAAPTMELGVSTAMQEGHYQRQVGVGASVGVRVVPALTVEVLGMLQPDLGQAQWKPITRQLINTNHVSPDIVGVRRHADVIARVAPLRGDLLDGRVGLEVQGLLGVGIVNTQDDMDALQCDSEVGPCALNANQTHPSATIGGGLRLAWTERIATRLDVRRMFWRETVLDDERMGMGRTVVQGSMTVGLGRMSATER